MQFYILMVDYGRNYPGKKAPSGYQAIVDPEQTRRSIVSDVSDILASDDLEVAFIKFVDGDTISDVTDEIVSSARMKSEILANAHNAFDYERRHYERDHATDYRKHRAAE